MSPETDKQSALKRAVDNEGSYHWLDAASCYEEALRSEAGNNQHIAEIWEKMGFCYALASRQADRVEEFRKLRQAAIGAYRNAAELFEKEEGLEGQGRAAHCRTVAEYERSWLAANPSEKRDMLDQCLRLGKSSLEAYEKAGDHLNYGKVCNDVVWCLLEKLYVAYDSKEMDVFAQEGINLANTAIDVLSKIGDKEQLLRAYFTSSLQGWYAANIRGQEEKGRELAQRSLSHAEKALALSAKVNNPYHAAMAHWAAAFCTLLFTEKVESALEHAEEMLKQGTAVNDNYLKGVASYVLSFVTNWMTLRESDPDIQKEGNKKVIKYGEDAIHYLELVGQDLFIAEACLFYAEAYSFLARDVEISAEEKGKLLKKALEIGRKGVQHATSSGSPDAMVSANHVLSKALHFYSSLEAGKDERKRLLEEALVHREEYNKITQRVAPSNNWLRGVGKNYEGLVKLDLAKLETDREQKRALLESAVSIMEDSVSHCESWILSRPVPTQIATVARFMDSFGEILCELYQLTGDQKALNRTVEVYEGAAKNYRKVNLPSRAAESYWKMARSQDRLGKHFKAAENFDTAFAEYKAAAQRIPHFADFYLDYATYMKAWSEVERAKLSHDREEYDDAVKHYERIAAILKPSKLWSYMSSDFLAWALLEKAEGLSRKESAAEAIESFKKAAELFEEAKQAFEQEIGNMKNLDEKQKAMELSNASIWRKDYCIARVDVEEARTFERNGRYGESAENYDSAATVFERILPSVEAESDRKEMKVIAFLCRAWQKMEMAEARNSSELFHEASEMFLQAKGNSTKEKPILLASGNSAFCVALEHGTKFEAAREKDDFLKAKQFLDSAANYYLKAGFDNASSWANAAGFLFDAYNYMIAAETETELEKKTKSYLLAEKCLERSAGLYEAAKYIGKRDEVLRTLEKVREKREFASTLGELVAAPSDASSTRVLAAPGMTVEEPVGLMKFEQAFIEANLIAHQRDLVVGENLSFVVQLANLGKNVAFLTRLEEIVPEGFELVEKPEKYVADDGMLNLRGKRLAALETEEMKLTLKPRRKGKFTFTPKILYMDEAGERKSCELDQVTVNVKEMGIRGWLKGPG